MRSLPILASVALGCALCLAPAACGSGALAAADVPVNPSSYLQKAGLAAQTLQSWYSSSTGLYASPSGWWNAANAITALTDYERVAKDTTYISAIANTFAKAQTGSSGHPNFTNTYYDDTGWWGLAWIDAYDLTGNQAYLSMAETIFTYMTGGWTPKSVEAACGGAQRVRTRTLLRMNSSSPWRRSSPRGPQGMHPRVI